MDKIVNTQKINLKLIESMNEKDKLECILNYNSIIDELVRKSDMIDLLNFEIKKLNEICSYIKK